MIIGVIILCVALLFCKNRAYFYRVYQKKVYNSFVIRLTKIVGELNIQKTLLFSVSDKAFIEYFESYLELLKTTIDVVDSALVNSFKQGSFERSACYVDECCRRAKVIKVNFLRRQGGGNINYKQLVAPRGGWYRKSCYFCSQPIFNHFAARTSIIVEGSPQKVLGCLHCKSRLKAAKKINILFFMQAGRRVHWSESDDYVPSVEYWDMNMRKGSKNIRPLSR